MVWLDVNWNAFYEMCEDADSDMNFAIDAFNEINQLNNNPEVQEIINENEQYIKAARLFVSYICTCAELSQEKYKAGQRIKEQEILNKIEIRPVKEIVEVRRIPISELLRNSVLERDGNKCKICGTDKDLCCDHVIPFSKGGKTEFENLQTLCRSCNSSKSNKLEN